MRKLLSHSFRAMSLPALFFIFFSFNHVGMAQLPACTNDLPCDAVDLGVISYGQIIGDKNLGIYDNTCGTNQNEPNPFDFRGRWNDAGVWFKITTDDNPEFLYFEAISDPENTGDPVDLEFTLYESTASCLAGLEFIQSKFDDNSQDISAVLSCPKPNTNYYLLVDGSGGDPLLRRGVFGLQVSQPLVNRGADLICDAHQLGVIPEGGTVQTDRPWSNYCSTGTGDPERSANFRIQVGVWFEFLAPPSGHIVINVPPDSSIQPLGAQIAVFGTDDGTCDGNFIEFGSVDNFNREPSPLEVSCLIPDQSYWLVVDGFGTGGQGIFNMSITDAGDITPRTRIDTVICAGESFSVGASTYTATGNFEEVINLYEGCDSIVFTDLTVLEPVAIEVIIDQPAIGLNEANGIATAVVSGGTGNYTVNWSNGESGAVASALVGNQEHCITVVDDLGCTGEYCFIMELETIISPSFSASRLDCFGDTNGTLIFNVNGGIAPYDYSFLSQNGNVMANGSIEADGRDVQFADLSGGSYEIRVNDGFGDTTFIVNVFEPELLNIGQNMLTNASCYGECDGTIELEITGGTGNYSFQWNDGQIAGMQRNDLCAGNYQVTVTDGNGCLAEYDFVIREPEEFVVTPVVRQDVSCFAGSDGMAEVSTNGNPVSYIWNNGVDLPANDNLPAGSYSVTVTNVDGCTANVSVIIDQPAAPLAAEIAIEKPISCAGSNDGRLRAIASGPGEVLEYRWNNASDQRIPSNLGPGDYSVTIVNEKSCEASAGITLTEPEPLEVEYEVQPITCLDNSDFGGVLITNITGGTPDYEFSVNAGPFQKSFTFGNLTEGEYDLTVKDGSGCRLDYQFFVEGPPEVVVDLGGNQVIKLGETLDLKAQTNMEGLDIEWFLNDSILNETGNTLSNLQLINNSWYRVHVFDPVTLCEDSDEVYIQVQKQRRVFIPTAFSPNGDGENDLFMVYGGPEVSMIKEFSVFDRNGSLVFQARDFFPETEVGAWDGNLEGSQLQSGTYVYYAAVDYIDGFSNIVKGEVILFR